ncbi:MAG: hypothetical protein SNH18_10385 [Rikenellaceae bacterium]
MDKPKYDYQKCPDQDGILIISMTAEQLVELYRTPRTVQQIALKRKSRKRNEK